MRSNVTLGERAIVVGGSIAGLSCATVLSEYFDEVVVLERDKIEPGPIPRKSVPQGRHIHSLLASGHRVLSALYPDFTKLLKDSNAIHYRIGVDTAYYFPDGMAYTLFGMWREPCDTGIDVYSQSRALVEHLVRQCTLKRSNVTIKSGCDASNIYANDGAVKGVQFFEEGRLTRLASNLMVDASGRGSRAVHWLNELGYEAPAESSIGVKFAYASARYRIPAGYNDTARVVLVVSADFPSGGILQEIEDRTWIVSLGSRFGTYPPIDEAGFLSFARNLHSPRIYELIVDAERIEDINGYRYPASLWRHYEQMRSFPSGFIIIGDAMCSFNPIYGQGMSVALLQVDALAKMLMRIRESGNGLQSLSVNFLRAAAKINQTAWTLAANLDLAYPQTIGDRPRFMGLRMRYSSALDALARRDPVLTSLLYEVYHLIKPISALTSPNYYSRAILQMCRSMFATD
jgi:2-polyprenyl-6-methoxyphenol hydroxylase-like FAD-dependent oxidoreductase